MFFVEYEGTGAMQESRYFSRNSLKSEVVPFCRYLLLLTFISVFKNQISARSLAVPDSTVTGGTGTPGNTFR